MNTWPANPPDVATLKRQAYEIKKATGARQCHVLEQLAKNHGYATWAALLAHVKQKGIQ